MGHLKLLNLLACYFVDVDNHKGIYSNDWSSSYLHCFPFSQGLLRIVPVLFKVLGLRFDLFNDSQTVFDLL